MNTVTDTRSHELPDRNQQVPSCVEVAVRQHTKDGALYLSTRLEGEEWTTHDTTLIMRKRGPLPPQQFRQRPRAGHIRARYAVGVPD